jgi:hypothetical protein
MSTHTISAGRYRPPAFAAITALAAVLVIAALAFALMTFGAGSFSGTGSSVEVAAPAAGDMPTPEWLESYLEPAGATSIPTPEWLEHYLELEAPVTG